ncbi:hypothetical protein MMC07_002867 [Pseudocyphellaria aurata]|nr:hypothetical protein [Pseudocyphellaria aurata]
MRAHQALKQLLDSIRSHEIALTEDDVGWAFKAKNTQDDVTNWVQQYLGKETLLSREEAELFSTLERNGAARRIAAGYDLETVQSFSDEDIEAGLSSLEYLTSRITEQRAVMELQRAALDDFQASNRETKSQFKRTAGLRRKSHLQEKQNTDLAVEELLQTLIQNATLAQQELQACHNEYPNRIATSLRQDDNMFRKLDEISAATHLVDESEEYQNDRLEKLCARLTASNVDEIRFRLDRTYLEAVQSSRNLNAPISSQTNELVSSIKAELETLYPEINAVASMFIDRTFKAPLAKVIQQNMVQQEDQINSVLHDTESTLSYIQEKAAHAITRLLAHDSHLQFLNTIVNQVETMILERDRGALTVSSPAAEQQSPYITPSKPVPVNNIANVEGKENPEYRNNGDLRQLLQSLGVPYLGSSNRLELQSTLDTVISQRERKAKDGAHALNQAIDSSLATYLNDAISTNSLLVGALLEDANFHAVELLNPQLESRKLKLGMEIDKIGSDMAGLDMDRQHMTSKKQEEMMKRWGC